MSHPTAHNPTAYPTATAIRRVLESPVPKNDDWTTLPGFSYSIALPEQGTEEMSKAFISTMLRLYAVGVMREWKHRDEQVQFATLCRFDVADGRQTFRSYAPYPRLIEFFREAIGDRAAVKKLPALL